MCCLDLQGFEKAWKMEQESVQDQFKVMSHHDDQGKSSASQPLVYCKHSLFHKLQSVHRIYAATLPMLSVCPCGLGGLSMSVLALLSQNLLNLEPWSLAAADEINVASEMSASAVDHDVDPSDNRQVRHRLICRASWAVDSRHKNAKHSF